MHGSGQELRSILLVEDERNDAMMIARTLQQAALEFPVVHVNSGVEAVAYLSRDRPYDDEKEYPPPIILLVDIRMPLMDGFDLLRWVRAQKKYSKIPVAMLTGSERIEDAHTAYRLGATSFFVKPFDFTDARELGKTLERLIANGLRAVA